MTTIYYLGTEGCLERSLARRLECGNTYSVSLPTTWWTPESTGWCSADGEEQQQQQQTPKQFQEYVLASRLQAQPYGTLGAVRWDCCCAARAMLDITTALEIDQ